MLTLTTFVPMLVCILGALVHVLTSNAKLSEMGRLAFFAGLLVSVFAFAKYIVHV